MAQDLLNHINDMKIIFLIFLFLFSAEFSFAQVYKWVDDKGIVHFTDDFMQIPEKHRTKVKNWIASEEKVDTKKKMSPYLRESRRTRPREEPYKDRIGKGEEYWKGQSRRME